MQLPSVKPAKAGFTLLEMSIVLAVIGLIIGGVLAGQGMMHTADMNNLISQVAKYKTVTDTFRAKYQSLPGDLSDAYDSWGAAAGCTNADVNSANSGCNGDGDNVWDTKESFRYWHHLYLSGLADGVWTCAVDVSTCTSIPGQFGPLIKIDRRPLSLYPTSFALPSITPSVANTFQISGSNNGTNVYSALASLMPVDVQRLDVKIDDGLPETGKMQAATNNLLETGNCVLTTTTPHSYDLSNKTTVVCNLWVVYE